MNEQEFWAALTLEEIKPPLYRLYYDDQGLPLFYSQEDLPGKYVDVDHETYVNPPKHVRIVDGKLQVLKINLILKLCKGEEGTPCHPEDISIVVDKAQPHINWSLK